MAAMSKVEAVHFPGLHDRDRPNAEVGCMGKRTFNVEVTGTALLYRAASSVQRPKGAGLSAGLALVIKEWFSYSEDDFNNGQCFLKFVCA